jgi:formylglycine-generating enzyme required for sulfatase activity
MGHTAIETASGGIALPALLLTGLAALIGFQTSVIDVPRFGGAANGPETVTISPRPFDYRAGGEFVRESASVDGPLIHVEQPQPLDIMKYQVSANDYAACVADGACHRAEPRRRGGSGNLPVTGVSFNDAEDYAAWLSGTTGQVWRLPTIEEWALAAGSKAVDHALGIDANEADPAQRWLLAYQRESALSTDEPATPMPLGSFGENEFGVADLSATVWEWTATCTSRTTLDAAGGQTSFVEGCGVRYLEGRHRTPMSAFVRDAAGGGCSVGVPPDNLGFRLVREAGWFERLLGAVI